MNRKTRLKNRLLSGCVCIIAMTTTHITAYAATSPHQGSADARIKTLTYRENDVFRLKGHYGFTTMIEFSPNEDIETTSIGDSEAWQVIPSNQRGNILFLKPLEPNAETNMTVLTNKRVYAFEMSASVAHSFQSNDLAFRVRFIYPEDAKIGDLQRKDPKNMPDPLDQANTSDWNFNYAYSGARRLRPERAFDDGTFTYLQFNQNKTVPAVFSVDEDGNESLVNFHMQGEYLVIERIDRQFTLRDGKIATCIFNESYQEKTGTQKKKTAIKSAEKTKGKSQPSSSQSDETIAIPQEETPSFWDFLNIHDETASNVDFNP